MSYIDDARAALTAELAARDLECDPELIELYLLLVLVSGDMTDLVEVHDAWAVFTSRRRPGHPDLVDFDDLPEVVQDYDGPFRDAIRAAADRIDVPGAEQCRLRVHLRVEHPELGDLGEMPIGSVDLGRASLNRQVDAHAALPTLLRDVADRAEAHHLPADTGSDQ